MLAKIAVVALAKEHRCHTALAKQASQPERADTLPDQAFDALRVVDVETCNVFIDRRIQESAIAGIKRHQAFQGNTFVRIGHVGGKPSATRAGLEVRQQIESLT